tara:strand:+ start:196 stop:432 length:237 start_codon:yes stop_codon:yes gene_type:complete
METGIFRRKALYQGAAAVAGFCITAMWKAQKFPQGGMRGYITRPTMFHPMMNHSETGKSRTLQTLQVHRLLTSPRVRL